jgi:RNA polymerase sigma-70 factor (ECF subfamily)
MLYIYLAMLETPEDKEKMTELYETYREYLCNVAQSILHNKDDAEDVLHQAFLRIANNFTNIGEVSCRQTRNYLVIIVRGLARNLHKKRGEHLELPIEVLEWSEIMSMDDPQLEQIEYEALHQALEELPAIHRDILYAVYFEGRPVKEIAKHIDLSEKAAQKRLERARQALQIVLKKRGWEA